jgi:N-carbamoylputrescine amidase
MKSFRVALIQTSWPGNRRELIDTYRILIRKATHKNARLVCLQEFTLSPYFASVIEPNGFEWAEPLHGGASDIALGQLARQYGIFIIGSIFEKTPEGSYYDTATIHNPKGELVGFTRKVHIPEGAGYHENHFFKGADTFPVHDIDGVKISIPTCYDQWFPELSRICAINGAEFIFYPTAIGSEPTAPDIDTRDAWQTIIRGQAIANGVYIAAANRIGVEGVTFYGSSFICDPMGNIVAQADRSETELIMADLDPKIFNEWRRLFPLLKQRRPEIYTRIIEKQHP